MNKKASISMGRFGKVVGLETCYYGTSACVHFSTKEIADFLTGYSKNEPVESKKAFDAVASILRRRNKTVEAISAISLLGRLDFVEDVEAQKKAFSDLQSAHGSAIVEYMVKNKDGDGVE